MKISIPDFALVVLVGPTGSGKSSFARRHFLETEIISSDHCRALVSDDETDQTATSDAFALLRYTAGVRLKRRKLAVIDATSVQKADRAGLVALARQHHALPIALVLDIDPEICHARNAGRPNRDFGKHVPHNHSRALRRSMRGLQKEGFRQVHVMRSPAEVDALEIERAPLWTDCRTEHGPFDIIGDIHGCFDELLTILDKLGYAVDPHETESETLISARHPEGRIAFFVGDLTDRGPRNVDSLRLVMGMCAEGSGRCVMGNHDFKLEKWLRGKNKITISHGLDLTVAELEQTSPEFRASVRKFIDGLRSHAWLADGQLVIAHAGLKEEMHGRGSGAVRAFAMFGDTTGEVDEFGLPVRLDWARNYAGKAEVVFGHTPMPEAEWLNKTMCVDTGCVFGGKLTALRWPERETVEVPAIRQYAEPARPLTANARSAQQDNDRLLYFDDYARKQRIEHRFKGTVLIPEENALAALEVTSRFGIDPRWLIHLPPTMAACPTAPDGPFLEHPDQAIDFFASRGVMDLIVQEKHMGSRALLVVAKDAEAAAQRFGTEDGKAGAIYTRTGRPFFNDDNMEATVVARIASALSSTGLWSALASDWVLLDAEVMPWSAKAQELLRRQYFPTVAAAKASATVLADALARAGKVPELDELRQRAEARLTSATRMGETIDGYCWPADSIEDYRIAPFHLLAAENRVYDNETHVWHMETLTRLAEADPILTTTGWRRFDASDAAARAGIVEWWLHHTASGGEGFVIKPLNYVTQGEKGLIQPAMKVRGADYLRIIYGPEYDLPANIERLRRRGLARKFSLADREFKLGLEGLHRFVEGKPLAKVHECALGVLALESEPVDPRL